MITSNFQLSAAEHLLTAERLNYEATHLDTRDHTDSGQVQRSLLASANVHACAVIAAAFQESR
ncbi:hypothetical protein [Amycolatopsis sp. CA-230715]|uniref:hypothetical protein n=1 Tax=Amycolatopsis sp. CA-230715 TaxID=2745196 RepID=UPI001C01A9D2|nr:hypothetical protein [Amycolatopsis sp. CA-230715]